MAEEILAARVRELLHYEPSTGIFTRKVKLAQRHQVGDRADFDIKTGPMTGYRRVGFDSKRYLAHRVAWLYVHGMWPSKEIDHINGDPSDNRIANLRDVPTVLNAHNKSQPRSDNTSGYLGVMPHEGRWRARIQVGGKSKHIGLYDTPELAHAAYIEAKRNFHEGFTR